MNALLNVPTFTSGVATLQQTHF